MAGTLLKNSISEKLNTIKFNNRDFSLLWELDDMLENMECDTFIYVNLEKDDKIVWDKFRENISTLMRRLSKDSELTYKQMKEC